MFILQCTTNPTRNRLPLNPNVIPKARRTVRSTPKKKSTVCLSVCNAELLHRRAAKPTASITPHAAPLGLLSSHLCPCPSPGTPSHRQPPVPIGRVLSEVKLGSGQPLGSCDGQKRKLKCAAFAKRILSVELDVWLFCSVCVCVRACLSRRACIDCNVCLAMKL